MPKNNPMRFTKSNAILRILMLSIFFQTLSCSTSDDMPTSEIEGIEEGNDVIESNDGDENEEPEEMEESDDRQNIFNYIISYMNYPNGIPFSDLSKKISIFRNEGGQITKRTGGIYNPNVAPETGISYFYDDSISDEVIYDENKIIIEKLSNNPELDIPVFKRTFILDSNNNIIQKIIETSDPVKTDTLDFEYNLNGKISKILYKTLTIPKESSFYYNNNENLDSIVTVEYDEELDRTIKTRERFENYDSAENPIKEFLIFEELFYRSLSKNNYSLYWFEVFTTTPSSSSFSSTYREWNLKYDADGNILFDEL
ncbi:MAG: hypothetical protein CMH48_11740 [Muricauda sp.]|nr:hypothetical protein [Allomuricauda sp.]